MFLNDPISINTEEKNIIKTNNVEEVYEDNIEESKTNCISKVTSEEKNEIDIEAAPSYINSIDLIEKK